MVGCWWWLSLSFQTSTTHPTFGIRTYFRYFVTCQNCFEKGFPSNPEWTRIPDTFHDDHDKCGLVVCLHDDPSFSIDGLYIWYIGNVVSIFHVSPYPLVASHRKWSVPLEVVAKCGLVVIVVVGWLDGTEVQFLEGVYKQLCVYIYIYITIIIMVLLYGLGWYQCMVYPPTKSILCSKIRCIFCCASIEKMNT